MSYQKGQDHDGLLEGIKLFECSSTERQISELRNSHNSEIGHCESAPPLDKHAVALPRLRL